MQIVYVGNALSCFLCYRFIQQSNFLTLLISRKPQVTEIRMSCRERKGKFGLDFKQRQNPQITELTEIIPSQTKGTSTSVATASFHAVCSIRRAQFNYAKKQNNNKLTAALTLRQKASLFARRVVSCIQKFRNLFSRLPTHTTWEH